MSLEFAPAAAATVSVPSAPRPGPGARLVAWALHDGNAVLGAGALLYAALYLAYWPRIFTTMDESAYMGMAYVFRRGTAYPDVAGVQVMASYPVGAHLISKYPFGMPALLAAVSFLGWLVALGVNLLTHLLTFVTLANLLRRLGVPAVFALLYLLHPTAVIYSRTVMADPATGLLLLAAFAALLGGRYGRCGLCAGLSLLLRTANAVALPVLGLSCLFAAAVAAADRAPRLGQARFLPRSGVATAGLRAAARFAGGVLPAALALAFYTQSVQGGGLSRYGGSFALVYFPHTFLTYAVRLSVLYPLMLIAPVLYRGPGRFALTGLTYGYLLLYSFWYFTDFTASALETFVIGQRFLLAVLPLFILAYAAMVWRLARSWKPALRRAGAVAAGALLVIAAIGIHQRHARELTRLVRIRSTLLRVTSPSDALVCNMPLAKLFHPALGGARPYFITSALPQQNRENAARHFKSGLSHPGARVFLALWIRGYRADEASVERQLIRDTTRRFMTQPLGAAERGDLPADIVILRVLGERPNERPAANVETQPLP